jgi:hypothetical protein
VISGFHQCECDIHTGGMFARLRISEKRVLQKKFGPTGKEVTG